MATCIRCRLRSSTTTAISSTGERSQASDACGDAVHGADVGQDPRIIVPAAAHVEPPLPDALAEHVGELALQLAAGFLVGVGLPPAAQRLPLEQPGADVVLVEPELAVQLDAVRERHEMAVAGARRAEGVAGGAGQKVDVGTVPDLLQSGMARVLLPMLAASWSTYP